jgi:hypothetical protein
MSDGYSGSDGKGGPQGRLWVIIDAVIVFWFLPHVAWCIQKALR